MEIYVRRDDFAEYRREHKEDTEKLAKAFDDGLEKMSARVCEFVTLQIDPIKTQINGVNDRLDIVNGRLYKHEGQISSLQIRDRRFRRHAEALQLSPKQKAAVAAGGSISVLAVLHSLFEMVKATGPLMKEALSAYFLR